MHPDTLPPTHVAVDEDAALEQELAEHRALADKREAAALRDDKRLELERLKLVEKFTGELGLEHEAFEVVQVARCHVVVKLGLAVVHKQFETALEENLKRKVGGSSGLTPEAMHKFVMANVVHPERDKALELFEKHQAALATLTGKLLLLYGGRRDALREKS